jgi:hypothetical protein
MSHRRLFLLVATALFFVSTFPDPAPAQTISFIARRDLAAGRSPDSVAVGDFNGDGKLDLAVATAVPFGPVRDAIAILMNNTPPSLSLSPTSVLGGPWDPPPAR